MPALTLDLLKEWLRYEADSPDADLTISVMLAAAVRHVEGQTGVLFTQREVTQPIYRLGARVPLFYGPREGDVVLSYVDNYGAPATLEVTGFQGRDMLAPAGGWPVAISTVVATYTAGYANPEDVPEDLMVAALLLAGNWDANREATVTGVSTTALPMGVDALLMPYRMVMA